MRIAIPLTVTDEFSAHFGGACKLAVFDVDRRHGVVLRQRVARPPMIEPCYWASWLRAESIDLLLAHGIGPDPLERLLRLGVEVWTGVDLAAPSEVVDRYLQGELFASGNPCQVATRPVWGWSAEHEGGCSRAV